MKLLLTLILSFAFFQFSSSQTVAQQYTYTGGCSQIGQCVNGKTCVATQAEGLPPGIMNVSPIGANCGGGVGRSVLGGVSLPQGVGRYNIAANAGTGGIGILAFISNLLNIFTIIAGLWVLFNIIRAAYMFITGMGNTGTYEQVKELATMSGIGVAIIAGAYIIAGLIGWIIFGDPTFILSPTLLGWNSP